MEQINYEIISFPNTVDAAYKTGGYKVQSLRRLKIVWNGPDVPNTLKNIGCKTHHFGYKTQIS